MTFITLPQIVYPLMNSASGAKKVLNLVNIEAIVRVINNESHISICFFDGKDADYDVTMSEFQGLLYKAGLTNLIGGGA